MKPRKRYLIKRTRIATATNEFYIPEGTQRIDFIGKGYYIDNESSEWIIAMRGYASRKTAENQIRFLTEMPPSDMKSKDWNTKLEVVEFEL